ncbi:hypothetical protein BCR41DRAFT_349003 [Lobosporangium transversale]|uniref:Uncharacterized protein n=1 Tax=Lobosporangium transversale TaxID=64571 RepID=A0A1Y2GTZ6_9FUNG|nr:hypothetical protein BCR41DRAFT_349003 [Lobosporangium transversale]ORZ23696.1 hypothetical protein BCR41DRAFT_349003 [Lobosporangium transversale]|eukprot:XP_021883510.1 hypothetical protein BCR41DRAFT_349003 [Lobosporangium transversale]
MAPHFPFPLLHFSSKRCTRSFFFISFFQLFQVFVEPLTGRLFNSCFLPGVDRSLGLINLFILGLLVSLEPLAICTFVSI